jgi:D-alanyl-lipoteichoic acid acyltransferase DltB (MBOAT superfamily)
VLFHSHEFLIFYWVIFLAYFYIPHRFRTSLLVVGSYLFYVYHYHWGYGFLLLFSTVLDYFLALEISKKKRFSLLLTSIFLNFGLLFFFKYYNFFMIKLAGFHFLPIIDVVVPIGISFYTFQTVSYTVDVYRGVIKSEKNFLSFASYVSFFPQLIAGPIERTQALLPQLKRKSEFNYDNFRQGALLFGLGLIEKVVLGDRLYYFGEKIFANQQLVSGEQLWLAGHFYFISIYCDFSGYTHMARGVAKTFNINLNINFKAPLLADSPIAFWNRWHTTLMRWFQDYIYLPIVLKNNTQLNRIMGILIVFFVVGIWRGASTHYIIWGVLSGLLVVLNSLWRQFFPKPKGHVVHPVVKVFKIILTFSTMNLMGMFAMDSRTLMEPINNYKSIFLRFGQESQIFEKIISPQELVLCVLLILSLFIFDFFNMKHNFKLIEKVINLSTPKRWGIYLLFLVTLLYLSFCQIEIQSFVYYQF